MKVQAICLIVGTVVICVLSACRQKPETRTEKQTVARTKEYVAGQLKTLEEKPEFKSLVPLCRDMLNRLHRYGSLAVTNVPEPFLVAVAEDPNTRNRSIHIRYLERESDLLGIRVREYWPDGETISEVYELSMGMRSMLPKSRPNKSIAQWSWYGAFALDVTERTNPGLRKDSKRWKSWAQQREAETHPPLYIAKPTRTTHVLISLIDEQGHESRAVPLTPWIVLPDANDSIEGTKR